MKHQNHITLLDQTKWANYFGFQVKETQFRIICKKLISFLIGPPGAGKSTTAQRLSRDNGYVYYEADAFFMFCNPFNDPNVENPSMSTMTQAPLKVWPYGEYALFEDSEFSDSF